MLEKDIERLTQISCSKLQKSLRWVSKQNIAIHQEWIKLEKRQFYRLKEIDQNLDQTSLVLIARYLAALEIYDTLHMQNKKNKAMDINKVAKTTHIQALQFKKQPIRPKFEKLLNIKSKIMTLKCEEGLSTRDISHFLQRYHHLEISHTSIAKFIKEYS